MQRPANHSFFSSLAVLLLVQCALINDADGADWEQWRGPSANGVSSETGLWPEALHRQSAILWRGGVGRGHSATTVRGERLYTMGEQQTMVKGQATFQEVVYCIDANTGSQVWHYAYPSERVDYPGPGSTPVLDGPDLFVVSRAGVVLCFEAESGRVRWRKNLVAENLARAPNWGFCTSPVIAGEVVLLNAGRSGLALSKRTGKVVWASQPQAGNQASPVVFDFAGQQLAAISARGILYVVDVASGEVQWTHRWETYTDPTILGTRMWLSGRAGRALLEFASGEPEVVWTKRLAGGFQGDVVLAGYAYGLSARAGREVLQCAEVASGEVKWTADLGARQGSLSAADGKLIILDGDGDLTIAKASPDGYQPISTIKMLQLRRYESYPETDPNACWTSPVFANGKIYARSTWGDLACIDVSR